MSSNKEEEVKESSDEEEYKTLERHNKQDINDDNSDYD